MKVLEKAHVGDEKEVYELYRQTTEHMHAQGIQQWEMGEYPAPGMPEEDIAAGALYVVRREGRILCAVTVDHHWEEQFNAIPWLFGVKPGCFHRLAILPEAQGQGLGRLVLDDVEDILRGMGCDCLRCDTLETNTRALALYEGRGMRRVGATHYPPDLTKNYPCLEKPLTADCPLLPVPMTPAFRGGKLTPWGGTKLGEEYGKKITQPTGESLEASCIPGLESTDPTGAKLPELIARYGEAFAGKYAHQAFPLLLKIIDAKDALSVQVHPDDAFAHEHESGKLGKTEAWLILSAEEGSQLVYGIKPGATLPELRTACEAGAAVSGYLRRVNVKPGDVCYIPAGCVHAIGAGIVLYEIQQSSDITYRFYDWDRVDAKGNKRELHLDKALAVTDLNFALDPVPAPDAPCARVLDKKFFTLDLLHAQEGHAVPVPAVQDFAFLTALDHALTLRWQGGERVLQKGDTVYLPTSCPACEVVGTGRAAVSMPK